MRGRVRVVTAPDQVDRDRGSVAQRAVGDAVPAVLGRGGLRGDPDAAARGDGGQPVVDVRGVLGCGLGAGGPQVQGGGADAAVQGQDAGRDLGHAQAAAARPRVVGGQGDSSGARNRPARVTRAAGRWPSGRRPCRTGPRSGRRSACCGGSGGRPRRGSGRASGAGTRPCGGRRWTRRGRCAAGNGPHRPHGSGRRPPASSTRARARTWTPAVVGVTARLVRCSSRTPSTPSSASRARDTAAWDSPSSRPASVKLPVSTMATRQRRCFSSSPAVRGPPVPASMRLAYRYRVRCILRMRRAGTRWRHGPAHRTRNRPPGRPDAPAAIGPALPGGSAAWP